MKIPTLRVKRKSDGETVVINEDSFDEKQHTKIKVEGLAKKAPEVDAPVDKSVQRKSR